MTQFTGRSLENTSSDVWAVEQEGGHFDQISGATISSRAVINAVHVVLEYYEL
ncbi:MAG: FMN-binding protein, partial [Candidatus Dadabacteria bacterium]|nr:FMN-binding protein [Candidatus Dadabacteria bacterium]